MNVDPALIMGALTTLGIGSLLTTLVTRVLDRNKTRADVTAVLSEASSKLVTSYQLANAGLQQDLNDAKAEVVALRGEVAELREVLEVVTEEKRWATDNQHDDAPVLRLVHPK